MNANHSALRIPAEAHGRAASSAAPLLFLSHAGDDSAVVRELADRLRQAGLEVWLDLEELKPGDRWMESLEGALERADAFAVYVGKTGIQSWVDREVRVALERSTADEGFRVVPILGAGADPDALPFFLAQHQWLDLRAGFGTPADLERLVGAILERDPDPISLISPDQPPFRGLLPFDDDHAHLFFGRDHEVGELLERLHADRFLAVVGGSGSGKSSLVKAGLVPALRRGRFHQGGSWVESWRIATLRPGDDPFRELATALCELDGELDAAARIAVRDACRKPLEDGTHGLHDCIAGLVPRGARTLLVIDQFEELFTLTRRPEARRRFIDSLLRTVDATGDRPVHCVITLRADFFADCWEHPELPNRIAANQFAVRRMDPARLQEIIDKPAAMAGLLLEPGLAAAMLHDAGDEPGNLPLLQHALLELWERRGGRRLTHASYQAIGRLQGALEHRAEEVYGELDAGGKELARRIFLSLTEAGKETGATRRPVSRETIETLGGGETAIGPVLRRLVDQRLLTVGRGTDGRDRVEVAHEALIRGWGRLRGWLEEDREFLLWRKRLQGALEAREQAGGDDGTLLRGGLLAEAQRWQERRGDDLDEAQQVFIAASTRKARRFQRLKTAVATTMTILALVAGVAAAVATAARGEAERRTEQAEAYLERARAAVDTMLTEVGHEALADVPQMEGVRQRLLEKARAFYQQFLEQEPSDPQLRREAAMAHLRVGDVHRILGRTADAEHAYREAIGRLERLWGELPADPETRRRLAHGHNRLGELLRESDRFDAAIELFDRVVGLQRDLDDEAPDRPGHDRYRQELARSHYNRGLAWMENGRPGHAEKDFLRAIALLRELIERDPKSAYRQELARGYNNLGALLRRTGRPAEARESYRQAIEVYRRLTEREPERREYRLELARAHNNLSNVLAELDQHEAAEKSNLAALALLEELAAAVPELRDELANGYNSRGGMLQLTGRPKQAEEAYLQAAGIFARLVEEFPERSQYRFRLGCARVNVAWLRLDDGDREGASREAEKLSLLLPRLPAAEQRRLRRDYQDLMANL